MANAYPRHVSDVERPRAGRGRATRRPASLRIAGLSLIFLLAASPAMAIEEPEFELVETRVDYELRRYPGFVVAEVEVTGTQVDAGNTAFSSLAGYIFGRNVSQESIAMTAPVIQAKSEKIAMTAPVIQQPKAAGTWIVQFTMPAKYTLATLPRPTDPKVRLREVPGRLVAVREYRGGWSQGRYDEELAILRKALARDGLAAQGPPQWARYNSPFSLPLMRRNEIWIDVPIARK